MNLRNRLILVFLAATLAPLGVTLWIASSLLETSLGYASTAELDELSKSLEKTARELYQHSRDALKRDVAAGRLAARRFSGEPSEWPEAVREFWESGEAEQFRLAGSSGNRLDYMVRRGGEVSVYSRPLGGVGMARVSEQFARARAMVELAAGRDLHRGLLSTLVLLAAITWTVAFAALVFFAHRITRPIRQLTAALTGLAGGDLAVRLPESGPGEVRTALRAFNNMAGQLQQSRERLLYLARLESWQTLARKTAHEVKNSLTPIRLTMEEVVARRAENDRTFLEQAAEIVVEEVNALERRVRAFSEFAAEPPVRPQVLDVNWLVEYRISLLKSAHPEVVYEARLDATSPRAFADPDLVKGVLTNLLENAAEATGAGRVVRAITMGAEGGVAVEVHDSGPGLSEQARSTLFAPTISFKKGGMGLGLSIARRSAVLSGGDILLVKGELGGAAFRVLLPRADGQAHSDR